MTASNNVGFKKKTLPLDLHCLISQTIIMEGYDDVSTVHKL